MKAKVFMGIITLAALAFVGCEKDEVKISADNAIEFGTYLGRDAQTKGSVFTTETMQGEKVGFGVFAYYTDNAQYSTGAVPNYMNNQQVTYSGGAWGYTPVKYWPNEATDYVSFFAYAPYREGFSVPASGDPVISFAVNTNVANQIDLVAADAVLNAQKQSINDKVKFTFKHALSRVGFKVEAIIDEANNQGDSATPDVDNEHLYNIADKTTISVQEVELIGTFNTSGKLNLNGATWTADAAKTDSYTLSSPNFADVAGNVTVTPKQLNNESGYLMLIPTETISISIRVKYTVTTEDDNLTDGKSVVVNDITSAEFPFTFAQGKAYNFVLHLGLTSVKLDAEVADWENAADYVVNVPNNF